MPIYPAKTAAYVANFACKPAIEIVWFCNEASSSLGMMLAVYDVDCFGGRLPHEDKRRQLGSHHRDGRHQADWVGEDGRGRVWWGELGEERPLSLR